MKKVNTVLGYDLYIGQDEKTNFKTWYNIVPSGSPAPTVGHYSPEYIAKIKKVSPSFFFPN